MKSLILVHAIDAGISYLGVLHNNKHQCTNDLSDVMANGASIGVALLLSVGFTPLEIMYSLMVTHIEHPTLALADVWCHDTLMGEEGTVDAHSLSSVLTLKNSEIDKVVLLTRGVKQWVQTGAVLRWAPTEAMLLKLMSTRIGDCSKFTLADIHQTFKCKVTLLVNSCIQGNISPSVLPQTTTIKDAMCRGMAFFGVFPDVHAATVVANMDHVDQEYGAWTTLFTRSLLNEYHTLQPCRTGIRCPDFPDKTITGLCGRLAFMSNCYNNVAYSGIGFTNICRVCIRVPDGVSVSAIVEQLLGQRSSSTGENRLKGALSPFSHLLMRLFLDAPAAHSGADPPCM